LTVDRLRSILTAAIGPEAGAYVDALQARRILPDDEPLNLRSVAIVALALVSGEEPAAAVSAALGWAEYQMAAVTQRCDEPNGAAMVWHEAPEPGTLLGDTLTWLMQSMRAGAQALPLPIFQ